jgi:hypothetical protein
LKEFFDLRTPQDHLKKLEREYAQLQADPGDVDTALSFFVTAAHLPELVKDVPYKKLLLNQELIVQICDELANRGKHGKSDRKNPAVLETAYDGWVERGWVERGWVKVTLRVTLSLAAARGLRMESQATDVLALATLALEFWKAHPAF